VDTNGNKVMINVVSLFCGCGGSSLGYERAGCKVLLASDFNPRALQTYRLNFPHTLTLQADIRQVNATEIKSMIGNKTKIDILDGSPPCTPFSMAGKREKGWNKIGKHTGEHTIQRTDDLFFEYIRLIGELKPKTFIAENVFGLIKGRAKDYYNKICEGMKAKGYRIKPFLLNAADFEVPQFRERVIIIGIRNDLKTDETVLLKKHPRISFFEAIKDLFVNEKEKIEMLSSLAKSVRSAYLPYLRQGQSIRLYHPKGQAFNYRRLKFDVPCCTLTCHSHQMIHPLENRWITLTEAKACASFPQDFKFFSSHDGLMRIGNSVPPNLIKNVAKYVIALANLDKIR
jgi:DNA (cytosine-5)-methyltransferase 1